MKKKIFNEITLSIILAILVICFLDPFMLWMPYGLVYTLATILVISFAFFASFVWKERAVDERDEMHKMLAGRVGYLLGSLILIVGLVWQTVFSHPDPWIVMALLGMVVGKLLGLYYGRKKL